MLVDLDKIKFGSCQFVSRDLGIRFLSLDSVPSIMEQRNDLFLIVYIWNLYLFCGLNLIIKKAKLFVEIIVSPRLLELLGIYINCAIGCVWEVMICFM